MLFTDRFDAALKLMPCLKNYKKEDAIIYAIPGGGVPIGYYLSKDYNFPMELLFAKKINHPQSLEMPIGAVTLTDYIVDKKSVVSEDYIKTQVARVRKTLAEQHQKFTDGRDAMNPKGKTVFIVDDGAATGNTMLSAIKAIREKHPKKIIVALPVATSIAVSKLEKVVENVICLHTIKNLVNVELNYLNYPKVTDAEIYCLMNAVRQTKNVA